MKLAKAAKHCTFTYFCFCSIFYNHFFIIIFFLVFLLTNYVLCSDDYDKLIRSLEEDYIEINKIKKELEHEESVNKKYGDQFAGFSDIFFAADMTPFDEFSVNERSKIVGQGKKVVFRSIFQTQSHI